MRITLSLQTDLNVKEMYMVLWKNCLPSYWAVKNKDLLVSLVNGLYFTFRATHQANDVILRSLHITLFNIL